MRTKRDLVTIFTDLLVQKKVVSLQSLIDHSQSSERTVYRSLKHLNRITSFTHGGQFVTLSSIPRFDANNIWFFRQIGFSKIGSSLDTIVALINKSRRGLSREELEAILKIGISKQIQILVQRNQIHRVKLGNQYLYLPQRVLQNTKKRLKIIGDRQTEEHFDKDVKLTDLIALLKAVLVETRIGIEVKSLKRIAQKFSLQIPVKKIEQLLLKYDLLEKKRPSRS